MHLWWMRTAIRGPIYTMKMVTKGAERRFIQSFGSFSQSAKLSNPPLFLYIVSLTGNRILASVINLHFQILSFSLDISQ